MNGYQEATEAFFQRRKRVVFGRTMWPRPSLPANVEDCKAYAEFLCRYGTALRALPAGTLVPECDPAVVGRCEGLVGAQAVGAVTPAEAKVAEKRIDWPEESLARNVELGRFSPEEQAALERAVPVLAAAKARRRASGIMRAGMVVVGTFAVAGMAWWWLRRRRRG